MPNLGIFKEKSQSDCDRLFYLWLVGFTLFHLLILFTTSLELVSDEALYFDFAKHLDWSFYSKGPLIGAAVKIGTLIFGNNPFGVRSVALVSFTIFSAIFYFFVRKIYSPQVALASFLLIRVSLIFIYTGFFATTDPLLMPFWIGSSIAAYFAISQNKPTYWILALPLVGIGMLAKYTAVILIVGYVAVLIFHKNLQHHLKSRDWWIGCALFLLSFSPVFIWNAEHHWVNFKHNLGHTASKPMSIPFKHLPELVAGQLGLAGPVFFILVCVAIWSGAKRWLKESDPVLALWLSLTVPLLLLCILVTLTRSCYANWPLPAYIGGLLLVIHEYRYLNKEGWFKKAIIVNVLITLPLQVSWYLPTILPQNVSLPEPIRRMVGWNKLGRGVENFILTHEVDGKLPFVMSTDYKTDSSLRFELPMNVEVRLGSIGGRRIAAKDFWQTWDELIGRDALIVQSQLESVTTAAVPTWFESCNKVEIEDLPPPSRMAKDYQFLFCKKFTGRAPNITGDW
jgi:4-amino-4-deoxy-L-arabinose transferase-like glycosyltransferase